MPRPAHYFYNVATSDAHYGWTMTNSLSVDQLLASKPCWQKPCDTVIPKKKTLIINDPSIKRWDSNQRRVADERLQTLQGDGFNVYTYRMGQFTFFTSCDSLEVAESPVHDKMIIQDAVNNKQLNLSHDEILIINSDEMAELMAGDDDDWRKLPSFKEADLTNSNISGASLRRFLLEKGDDIERLNLSRCINLQNASLDGLKLNNVRALELVGDDADRLVNLSPSATKQLIDAVNNTKLDSVALVNLSEVDNTFQALAEKNPIKSLKLRRCDFADELRGHFNIPLEILDLDVCNITNASITKMLNNKDHLKTLILNSCMSLTEDLFEQLSLPSLERLHLNGPRINSEKLGALLVDATHLKSLKLFECNLIDTLPAHLKFASLDELNLFYSSISAENLSRLLVDATHLETLDLDGCSLADRLSETLSLVSMKTLNWAYATVSAENLAQLLADAKNINSLNLLGCNLTGALSDKLRLASLEELYLSQSNITGDNLVKLISGATRLKSLKLSYCNLTDSVPTQLTLASLDTLDLAYATISAESLGQLLANATALKTLNLTGCTLTGHLPDQLMLSSLEELYVSSSTINGDNLGKLLSNSDHLKKLESSNCKLTGHLPDTLALISLDVLDLSNTTINTENLDKLLAHAPHLKTLHLPKYCRLDQLPNKLTLLEELHVSRSAINEENLGTFLLDAKHIKILKLSECSLIDNLPEKLAFASVETLNLFHSTISGDNLCKLLADSTHLKTLDLRGLKLKDDLPNTLNFPLLIELDLNNSTIYGENLIKFLAHATHLKKLTLSSLYEVSSDFIEKIRMTNPGIVIYHDRLPSLVPTHTAPPPIKSYRSEQLLDANTAYDPEKTFNVEHIFHPGAGARDPEISHYRLQSFNSFEVNDAPCFIGKAFLLKNDSSTLQLEARDIPRSQTDLLSHLNKLPCIPNNYYGRKLIQLSYEWQPLPSLTPNDVMKKYHINDNADVDIHYSLRDNMYYIRSKPGSVLPSGPVHIDFIIDAQEPHLSKTYIPEIVIALFLSLMALFFPLMVPVFARIMRASPVLPNDVISQINSLSSFNNSALTLDTKNPTGHDYLDALNQQHVGACRHRTFLFKSWMHEHHPEIPVRIINNDCHSFIELQFNGQWCRHDLGGYPAQLVVSDTPLLDSIGSKGAYLNEEGTALAQLDVVELTAEGLIKVLHNKEYFPPEKKAQQPNNVTTYIHQLLSNNHRGTLIKLDSQNTIAGLRYHVQKQCKSTHRPCFYIHSPGDLICQAPYIELSDNNTGTLKKGPGGKLHQFLTNHAHDGTKPVLIVNYDQFSPSDIVRFNALLDTERKADGTILPYNTQVIGLINPAKPGAYDGADFYSRFDYKDTCLLSEMQLDIPPIVTKEPSTRQANEQLIECYGGSTWEEQLLGSWSLDGQSLRFNEGELVKAFRAEKTHLNLSNAPWGVPAFECFWETALLNGSIEIQGKTITLPDHLTLSKSEGYAFDYAQAIINTTDSSTPEYVLNPGTMGRLFGEYRCRGHAIYPEKGLFEKHAGKRLSFYVSHALSDAAWSRILDACQRHKVQLNLTLAHGVELPKGFNVEIKPAPAALAEHWFEGLDNAQQTAYIASTDIDVTLASLKPDYDLIIDVSEVDPADLIKKISAQFDEKSLRFHFDEKTGALRKALNENKNIILKGHFSEEMQHALSDVLFQRQQNTALPSRLMLIGTKPNVFTSIPSFTHVVTLDDKKRALPTHHKLDDALIQARSLVELKAIARHPSQDAASPWKGMETLPLIKKTAKTTIDLSNAEDKARAFNQHRVDAVNLALANSPFVFLAGMSGVGKTSFIKHVWKQNTAALHVGKDNIKVWADDKTPGIKTLFLDEANISSRHWSEFEGLFNTPPSILIGNEYITLTPDHKVIFAGNPLSYGGERQMPLFFKRHGNSVIFDPMPPEYIYQDMLKPLGGGTDISEAIALPILQVADYLTACSVDNILITPRELVAMALFTQCYCANNPNQNPSVVARYYAWNLSKNVVPDAFKDDFEKKFKVSAPTGRQLPDLMNACFISTKSNESAREALEDFLTLRQQRQTQQGNAIQQYGGLGGLILEGEPGLGKTELVAKTLVEHGLIKGSLSGVLASVIAPDTAEPRPSGSGDPLANAIGWDSSGETMTKSCVFYVIPVSMRLPDKEALLLKAFHEGAVVVMDEMNSAPMMEGLLNDLLMGQAPDGKPPATPGFLLIGTQNPVSMAGRAKASTALQHRMQTVMLPDYHRTEMINILQLKGLPENTAQEMVHQYLEKRQKADENPALYKLCFRDLLKRAEHELRGGTEITKEIIVAPSIKEMQNKIKAVIEKRRAQGKDGNVESGIKLRKT